MVNRIEGAHDRHYVAAQFGSRFGLATGNDSQRLGRFPGPGVTFIDP